MAMELARDSEEFEYEKVIVLQEETGIWSVRKMNYNHIEDCSFDEKFNAIAKANEVARYVEVEE